MNIFQTAILGVAFVGACQSSVSAADESNIQSDAKTKSDLSYQVTRDQLRSAIEQRGIQIIAEVDHAAGARSVDLHLSESTLFIFGNPRVGTPLMQLNPEVGLDLPMKALVYEQDDEVYVLTSDIRAITSDAEIAQDASVIQRIENVLSQISADAVSTSVE